MDLIGVEAVACPGDDASLPPWRLGDAPLAGGTWLFSEPQPGLRRLVDLAGLGWDGLAVVAGDLHVGATCPIARLAAFEAPSGWRAAGLFRRCAESLVASFKVQSQASVGGNLCLALPAGSMIALAAALEGTCEIRRADGTAQTVAAEAFVTGVRRTVLDEGALLRRIVLPGRALSARAAFRRVSLSPQGRTGSMVIGTWRAGACRITVTGATARPVVLSFDHIPDRVPLEAVDCWHEDLHGALDWRRHVTSVLAGEVCAELAACD